MIFASCASSKKKLTPEEEAMEKLMGAMANLAKVEFTSIEKSELPDELKKSFRNEPKVSGYNYKKTTIKGVKEKYKIPIP